MAILLAWLVSMFTVLLPTIGGQLHFIGGTYKRLVKVVVWPALVGIVLWLSGVAHLGTAVLVAVLLGAAHSLPYGEKFDKLGKPMAWFIRSLVGLSYGLAFYPLYHTIFPALITVVAFVPLYAVSRNNNDYSWPSVENAVGSAEGSLVLYAILLDLIQRIMLGG